MVAALAPGATTLPLARFTGVPVFPVIFWDAEAVSARMDRHPKPLLDEGLLAQAVDSQSEWDPPSPLTIHGFVSVGSPSAALRDLSGLRALGRTIAAVSSADELSAELMTRFDLQGTAVVSLDDGELIVPGDPGPAPGARYDAYWKRVRIEQLYSLALEAQNPLW